MLRLTVCGDEMFPTEVEAKLSEPCDRVKVDKIAALLGLATAVGPACPEKAMLSGLEAASLSMMREPASVVAAGEPVPLATWLVGV